MEAEAVPFEKNGDQEFEKNGDARSKSGTIMETGSIQQSNTLEGTAAAATAPPPRTRRSSGGVFM